MSEMNAPLEIGTLRLKNRLYRAPVLEGAGSAADPAAEYARHFVPNVEAGLGLVVQGNTIVLPEGRTSLGMSAISGREKMLELAPMVRAVHEAGGKIVTQLGHGGSFALESWHRELVAARTSPPWAPSPLPLWLRPFHSGVHVLSTEEVDALVERFGLVAAWAREAGYDGVQLAGSNAKLLHQFLSPTYNRRDDRYGGSLLRRSEILRAIRRAIAERAGEDFPVLLKYPAVEETPFGLGYALPEGIEIGRIAAGEGYAALTPVIANVLPTTAICRGAFPAESFRVPRLQSRLREAAGGRLKAATIQAGMWLAARRYPFQPLWNREVFRSVRQATGVPVFGVGGIRTPAEARAILAAGEADLVGIGRPFYAEPDLARRFLDPARAASAEGTACESCNRCIVPQMLGLPGVCYNPAAQKKARKTAAEPAAV
jgi:2,4-dienoyl-CoA reductase-like NADH-dependent reductase (Old Yellow Enzyme family)